MSTVLWGARRGDVQYGSRSYWMTRIPIGAPRIRLEHAGYFTPGTDVMNMRTGAIFEVIGREGDEIGVRTRP